MFNVRQKRKSNIRSSVGEEEECKGMAIEDTPSKDIEEPHLETDTGAGLMQRRFRGLILNDPKLHFHLPTSCAT